jgi:hypothetical protein
MAKVEKLLEEAKQRFDENERVLAVAARAATRTCALLVPSQRWRPSVGNSFGQGGVVEVELGADCLPGRGAEEAVCDC